MSKQKLSQTEIDKIVVAGRVVGKSSVFGVGFNDVDFSIKIGGKMVWQHQLWVNMIRRCFCEKYKLTRPTYYGVTCCDEWLSFGNFFEWVNKEVGYSGKPVGMELDKDLMVIGNKTYSPTNCSFVPRAINALLNTHGNTRGQWPLGVSFYKKSGEYRAQLNYGGVVRHLGYHNTPEDAFSAYRLAKEAQVKVVATQHRGSIKPAVYEALMNWKVE